MDICQEILEGAMLTVQIFCAAELNMYVKNPRFRI